MAYLLGSKFCIESLQSDVKDLQTSITDVFSRVGPVRFPSWKYPDKISSDIDVGELLKDAEFCEGEDEDNQVAHILMLEMVIDRMTLLFQSFTHYTDQLLANGMGRPPTAGPSKAVGNQMSIGLVVKKCWNKMVQLSVLMQQLQSENRSKSRSLTKLENINLQLQEKSKQIAESARSNPTPMSIPEKSLTPPGTLHNLVAVDTRTTSCQTIETSFVPCEACYQVQLGFKDVSDTVVDVCTSQHLSSAVAKHRKMATEETMTAADVHRWRKEEQKDLQKIKDHLTNLMEQIDPLKDDLKCSREKCSKLTEDLSVKSTVIAEERKTRETAVAKYEIKIKNIQKQHKDSLAAVERSYDDMKRGKRKVDEEIVTLKQELLKQHEQLKDLDVVKKQLNKISDENTEKKNNILRLESDVKQMTEQLADTHQQLEDTSRKLGKEQAKNRSLEKQSQVNALLLWTCEELNKAHRFKTMQVKIDNLVARIDELDQETQDLQDNIAELEDTKDEKIKDLENALLKIETLKNDVLQEKELVEMVRKEKDTIESSAHALQTMILNLEERLKESQERERLLVQNPESNPHLASGLKSDKEGTGLREQIQANNIRIQVLEGENSSLRDNISKLLEGEDRRSKQNFQAIGPGVQLWQNSSLQESQLKMANSSHVSPRAQNGNNLFSFSSPPKHTINSEQKLKSSPKGKVISDRQKFSTKSGKGQSSSRSASSKSASIHAYIKLKNSGNLPNASPEDRGRNEPKPARNIRQGWMSGDTQSVKSAASDHPPTFFCPACDKVYTTQRDLDIHKSYCYG